MIVNEFQRNEIPVQDEYRLREYRQFLENPFKESPLDHVRLLYRYLKIKIGSTTNFVTGLVNQLSVNLHPED